jgi:creatinine amidohydrolase
MSSPEIAAIPKDEALLLLPVGCIEQHGPTGYTGADSILADYVCRQASEALEAVYVAPALWYGYTHYHQFPGTVSLRLETLTALIGDVLDGYVRHGFRHIVVVNNHGPNEAAIEPVAARLRVDHGIVIAVLYPWRLANHLATDLYSDTRRVYGHGGEPTISIMMALTPGAVASTAPAGVTRGYVSPPGPFSVVSYRGARFDGFEVGLFSEAAEVLPSGASGDWTVASEERGREILRRIVDYAVRFLPAYLTMNRASVARHDAARHGAARR